MAVILDISNNNAHVDLARVKKAGIAGVWHKVTEGEHFVDRYWIDRRNEARRLGLRVGGYHFARPGKYDAIREAEHFVSALGKIGRKDLAPVLDFEVSEGLSGAMLVGWARQFNHVVHKRTGVWPIFYSYPSFISQLGARRVIGRGLWLASYGRNDGVEHSYFTPRPFKKALAHQFTSRARVSGVAGYADLSSARRIRPLLAYPWLGLL